MSKRPTAEEVERRNDAYMRTAPRTKTNRINYTARAKAMLKAGVHPLTKAALRQPVGEQTCGECVHFRRVRMAKTYFKCAYRNTASEATDIRKSWPACERFEAK